MTSAFRIVALVLLACALFGLVLLVAGTPIPPPPRLGHRGAERQRAIAVGGFFAVVEPLVRFLAGLIALLPLERLRRRQERELRRADHYLGITPDEYTALAVISAVALSGSVAGIARMAGRGVVPAIAAGAFGLLLPTLQIQEVIRQRTKEISRGLPHAIEIAAMCMGAGLDFPSAMRLIAGPSGGGRALAREFAQILEELELGHTRRQALLGFAERVPISAVRDLVNAIIQAEQKGNPLAKVIQVQGRMLNMRRSVAAEEAAARAGVLMIAPMMLLVGCIVLLLLGPFMVKGIGF